MSEGTENLVLEHLRAIPADIARIKQDISTLKVEMIAMRQHQSAMLTLQEHDHADIATISARLDRIERRLELAD